MYIHCKHAGKKVIATPSSFCLRDVLYLDLSAVSFLVNLISQFVISSFDTKDSRRGARHKTRAAEIS